MRVGFGINAARLGVFKEVQVRLKQLVDALAELKVGLLVQRAAYVADLSFKFLAQLLLLACNLKVTRALSEGLRPVKALEAMHEVAANSVVLLRQNELALGTGYWCAAAFSPQKFSELFV